MKLYLVQHGEAVSAEVDPGRPLTGKGREDARKVAGFLKAAGITVDVIWHSAKRRAIETAGIFEEALGPGGGSVQKEGLAPNDPAEPVLSAVEAENRDIMLVGHLPFLQKLASMALSGNGSYETIRFIMAGAVCLEREGYGSWRIGFMITPDLLKV